LKGRYAFRQAFDKGQYLVPRMKDNSALVEKPDIHLKPQEFLHAIINDPRGLPYSERAVVKYKDAVDEWFKVKVDDTLDVKVMRCVEGTGKFAGSPGAMAAEGPTGVESEVGSFQLTNEQQQWICDHRDVLTGQIAEVRAMNVNESGAIRAGVFVRFHPSRSEAGLLLYSESLAGGGPEESRRTLYRLNSAAGWERKV